MAYPGDQMDYGGGVAAAPMVNYLVTDTTTNLADVAATINTTDKFTGKAVYNTTTGIVVYADGPDADDKWAEADGTDEHTPV